MSTLVPALEIIILSYLYFTHDKSCRFPLLGLTCDYSHTLSAPSHLEGFLLCLINRYNLHIGVFSVMTEIQVYIIVWWVFFYAQGKVIFLLSPYVILLLMDQPPFPHSIIIIGW